MQQDEEKDNILKVHNKPTLRQSLSREEKIFVSLAAQILVTKTINDATKFQSSKISPLQ